MSPEMISAIGSIAAALIGALALYQIKVAKDGIQANAKTSRAAEAARQCERYIDKFLPEFRSLNSWLKDSGYQAKALSFSDYVAAGDISDDEYARLSEYVGSSSDRRDQVLDALNQLEILSVTFNKTIAAEDVAYRSLVFSYCIGYSGSE